MSSALIASTTPVALRLMSIESRRLARRPVTITSCRPSSAVSFLAGACCAKASFIRSVAPSIAATATATVLRLTIAPSPLSEVKSTRWPLGLHPAGDDWYRYQGRAKSAMALYGLVTPRVPMCLCRAYDIAVNYSDKTTACCSVAWQVGSPSGTAIMPREYDEPVARGLQAPRGRRITCQCMGVRTARSAASVAFYLRSKAVCSPSGSLSIQ